MDEVFHEDDDERMIRIGERFARLAVNQLEQYLALDTKTQASIDRLAGWCQEIESTGASAGVMLKSNGYISVKVNLSEPSPW